MENKHNKKIIEALYIVIDEFEEHPINGRNETLLDILADRIETITTRRNYNEN